MKKYLSLALLCLALAACSDKKAEEKVALDAVIKIHDNVMGYEEQLMHNKMKLDTLLTEAENDEAKTKMHELSGKLVKADAAMSDWMQSFDPAPAGKTHDELMTYFADQKKQVTAVDSMFVKAVKESAEYLKPFEKK